MDTQTFVLMSGNERLYCAGVEPALTRAKLRQMPASQPEFGAWAQKVVFKVRVLGVGGDDGAGKSATAPTKWSLGVRFEYELAHTELEQYLVPAWATLDTTTVGSDIEEGQPWSSPGLSSYRAGSGLKPAEGGYGVIATNVSSLPLTVKRTPVNFGRDVRIALDPFAEDGTNPYINAVVLAEVST